ncbi:DUF4329 domain-containing protein [Pseudomonas sp. 14P_8.1_Bac3]|uniref:DUF4329 domain-containing protein n=1 Tax=Pseudomonas sp. 14P_8.1_Bac3 TaxID=2971621 RepID=UPI0021CA8EF1|nr:DUF4329 domain-containing protein [Pseudomonas sp. 14P_8.1_Bac3]MCU1763807.1 DUF4329 domain-containing protein [Pseudomonas sp. 14P_8.1_Bac3]
MDKFKSPPELPELSPPFISADDAARFAHEAIGNKRDKEYGGLILQGEGGRFFATQPIAGDEMRFDVKALLATDAKGLLMHPAGFKCQGIYHSHPDGREYVKKMSPNFTDRQAELVVSFFSDPDKLFMIRHQYFCPAFYLSGSPGCLLKYQPSGSLAETQLLQRLEEGRAPDSLVYTEEVVDELAKVGVLSLIVPNELWGNRRGQFDGDWAINHPVNTLTVATEQPFYTPIFDQATKAIDEVMNANSANAGFEFMGFILKALGKEEYVATLPWRDGTSMGFGLDEFPARETGGPRLPSGLRIDGVYSVSQAKPAQVPARQAWLYKNFFSPVELAEVIAQSRKNIYLQDPQRGLTVYRRTASKALLSYTCSGSAAETALMAAGGDTTQKALKAGTLLPFEFVQQVAAAGRLTVLQTGNVWDKVGIVGPAWRPFERIHQSFSPAFLTADDAVRHVHYQMAANRDIDQLGYVLERHDGKFFATAPVAGDQWRKDGNLPFAGGVSDKKVELPGYRYVAIYVARADAQAKLRAEQPGWSRDRVTLHTAVPSLQHLEVVTSGRESITALYNSGPDESLVRYVRSGSQQERNFSALLASALKTGEINPQFDGFDGQAETLVTKLVSLGEFKVLISSPVWKGSRGKVPGNWVAYQPFVPAAPVNPALSWVFKGAEAGADWAHDLMRAKPEVRQIAFILKSAKADEYVVTDPVAVDSGVSLFSAMQAFAANDRGHPALPDGYEIQGVCYLSLPERESSLKDKWLQECFVSPTDLALAIGTYRAKRTSGFELYLSTRDDAQLKYVFSRSPQENQLYTVDPLGQVTDNGDQGELATGKLAPAAFVRRVAAAGALSVVRTGKLWDVEGDVGQSWVPFARYPKPVLSPAFLTADDAARYAHERIGHQRDTEFSGYILQREDQRFVVTEPLDNYAFGRFALGHIYPEDVSGSPLLPQQHVLHAVYASRKAFSLYDPARMKRHGWDREQASIDAQLFSDRDLHTVLQNRQRVPLVYLSSAEDALIAYDTSGSAAELELLKQVTPGPAGSQMAQDLASGAVKPEDVVKQLAHAGSLRVVIASELWGARGMVPRHWSAYPASRGFETPEQVAFGAVFADADAAARDAHERVRRCGPDQTCFGFVLKHLSNEEYVVSETVAASDEQPLFSLASLFQTHHSGEFVYPASFKLFGLFYARQWMPKKLGATEQWLGRHFISSKDLYEGFFVARRLRPEGSAMGLPVYLSTLERALLKYQSPNTTTLFDARIQPSGVAEDVHTRLNSGQLLARDFVTQAITHSWLNVVVGNECWGEQSLARLTAEWKPYSAFARRALSPAFTCQVDAVRHVERLLGADREQIYGGLVLKRGDGLFVATEPLRVATEDFDPKQILPDEEVASDLLAPGCTIVARYRSRVASEMPFLLPGLEREVYRDCFSSEVLSTALASDHLWTHEYLLGAEGSILGFSLHDDDHDLLSAAQKRQLTADLGLLETELAPSTDSPHDPWSNVIERRIRSGAGTPTQLVNRLLKVGALQVVQSSNLWGPARKLSGGWMPQKQGFLAAESVRFAEADRALSPAFCHMDDAVRYAHEQAGKREQWAFGFVLTSSRLAHSITSLPVIADDLKFPYERVFLRGQLPTGYSVRGIYLCAPARQPDELPRSEVFRSFVPPSVLAAALSAVEVMASGAAARFQSLYVSCADGALLKYDAAAWDSDLQTHAKLTAYVKTLQGDGNPADYIHKVARSGEMTVLVRSATWATAGRVGPTWAPGKVATSIASDDEHLALGPLCAHPDDAARLMWRRVRYIRGNAWLGAILRDGVANFVATEPLDDTGPALPRGLRDYTPAYRRLFADVKSPAVGKYPVGFKVMGVQQLYKTDDEAQHFSSSFEEALYRNFVAHEEIRELVTMLRVAGVADGHYYLTPRNGALLSYAPDYRDAESQALLNEWNVVENGVTRSRLAEVLTTLAATGKLRILEPDRFWNPRGHVTAKLLLEMSRRHPAN